MIYRRLFSCKKNLSRENSDIFKRRLLMSDPFLIREGMQKQFIRKENVYKKKNIDAGNPIFIINLFYAYLWFIIIYKLVYCITLNSSFFPKWKILHYNFGYSLFLLVLTEGNGAIQSLIGNFYPKRFVFLLFFNLFHRF